MNDLSIEWQFDFIKSIDALSFSFVALVELSAHSKLNPYPESKTAILKAAPEHGHIVPEAHWLQSVQKGVPMIYAVNDLQNAYLMEYLTPGYSLKSLVKRGKDIDATRIICQTILDLQVEQKHIYAFKHLSEFKKDLLHLKGHVDPIFLSKTETLFQELTENRSQDVLLHGDLHHDNIIFHQGSWRVIDPKGYIGDAAAEVGVMIRNPIDAFPTDKPLFNIVENRLKILCETLPFDAQRIKQWAFCMTMLSAAWNIEDFGRIAQSEFEIAKMIEKVNV